MSFKFVKKVISPSELLQMYPMPEKDALVKKERDDQIKDVFTGVSDKFIVIISADF